MRLIRIFLLAVAAAVVAGTALAAQTVTGRLVDGDGRPVERVLVALVDTDGHQRAAALTNAEGAFTVAAPGPGEYALRAERIGYATVGSPRFTLAAGETRDERLVASGRAVALQELRVTAQSRRCAIRPRDGLATATLWEEARKALNATAFGERERIYRYDVARWTRELDPATGAVVHEERTRATGIHQLAFGSAPAAELERFGYVRSAPGDSLSFFAPDADVLLSAEFLAGHCFRVREGSPREIGLAFEPEGGHSATEVRGVLWLDRATAELRRLEYSYVDGPPEAELPGVGGTVEFRRLADGPWIVSRWAIRMPVAELTELASFRGATASAGVRMEHLLESGGEVSSVAPGDGASAAPVFSASAPAVIEGVVWDSTRNAPLGGARVFLSGTAAETVTGADGRFRLQAAASGRYTLAFADTTLGVLAGAVRHPTIDVAPGRTEHADLAVPSPRTLVRALCDARQLRANGGAVAGRVSGVALDSAEVEARWTRVDVQGSVATARSDWARARPDGNGWFLVCGVPEGRDVRLTLLSGRAIAAETAVTVTGLLRQDLAFPPPTP